MNKGEQKEGRRLIKQAHKIAIDYDFTFLACELCSILFRNNGYYEQNIRTANRYAEQVDHYLAAYVAEKKIEREFFQIIVLPEAEKFIPQIEAALPRIQGYGGSSLRFKVYEAILQLLLLFYQRNYQQAIATCTRMLEQFAHRKGAYRSHYQIFLSKRGLAHMALGQFDQAAHSLAAATEYAPARSRNDYLLRYYKTLNALHSGDYARAYALFQYGKKCPFEDLRQLFAIIEAYLCFLHHSDLLHLDKTFRMGKYLNDTFRAQANKQGDNVNIIIAELLVYLARNRSKFIDRIEAVRNYSYRHLRDDHTRRAKWFIKILCLIPKSNFHPQSLQRYARPQLEKLAAHPLRLGENYEIEIIPFEKLLDLIYQQLERYAA
ncbi:MAG: hypothetical protein AAFR05_14680 [Bacteroidota bacterium]